MLEYLDAALPGGIRAVFTGRDRTAADPVVGQAGNLAHRRPHRPRDLAAARREVARVTGTDPTAWHLLHQVHGPAVAEVDGSVPEGTELRGVDGVVTALPDRTLVVQTADCAPVLLAGRGVIGAAHAGRAGVLSGVVPATVAAMRSLAGDDPIHASIGPTIGPCCYEVPAGLRAEANERLPGIAATTTWGTPSLDLPGALLRQLQDVGVEAGDRPLCTRCDDRFFSHRRDPDSGRQVGLIVRREETAT